jgi:hypothetical protein
MGAAPRSLAFLSANKVMAENKPAATVIENKAIVNIQPFAVGKSPAKPTVAAAIVAALGALTPMP